MNMPNEEYMQIFDSFFEKSLQSAKSQGGTT